MACAVKGASALNGIESLTLFSSALALKAVTQFPQFDPARSFTDYKEEVGTLIDTLQERVAVTICYLAGREKLERYQQISYVVTCVRLIHIQTKQVTRFYRDSVKNSSSDEVVAEENKQNRRNKR